MPTALSVRMEGREVPMENPIFRKKSIERISEPEQLNDYLHVASPAVWAVLLAVAVLMIGLLVWSSVTAVDSYAEGTAEVREGVLTVTFDDPERAKYVAPGMEVSVGEFTAPILYVGADETGRPIAVAEADVPDGSYSARVGYKRMQIIRLLLN